MCEVHTHLSQITQAVQNALRSPEVGSQNRRAITTITQKPQAANECPETENDEDVEASAEVLPATTPPSKPRVPRKAKSPNVLDVDLVTEPSFESYAKQKNPTSDSKRYLVVAAWFKLHRGVDEITADHVYTCFRKIKWPTNRGGSTISDGAVSGISA